MIFIIIGFIAEFVDGTIGMAYGVSCRTLLTIFRVVTLSDISAIIHFSELPSSFLTFITHLKFKNIDKKAMFKLSMSGIIGAIIGSKISVINFNFFEPVIDTYLIIMGIIIVSKYFTKERKNKINYYIVGLIGALFDVTGGGGYGPIVTSSILGKSSNISYTIGTVNSSEFFVTLTSTLMFGMFIPSIYSHWKIILELTIGGIIAAPLAARLCIKNRNKKMYLVIGSVLIILNIYNLLLFILERL